MNNFNHPRDVMPFAIMLYLMMSMAQLHANQGSTAGGYAVSFGRFMHSVEWHMLEIAQTEQGESLFIFPPGPSADRDYIQRLDFLL
jgi:hypothetical protein